MFLRLGVLFASLVIALGGTTPAIAQDPAPSPTLWRFLGIPQASQKTKDHFRNRKGFHPEKERKPHLKRLTDPANLASGNPAISRAAEIKQQEDLAPQKIKAVRYLGQVGCGCYDRDGSVTDALLAALDDCTESVRLAAIQAIAGGASGSICTHCNERNCCSGPISKRLEEMAYKMDDKGCFIEPSPQVRAAAAEALQFCPPPEEEVPSPEAVDPDRPTPQPVPQPVRQLPLPQAVNVREATAQLVSATVEMPEAEKVPVHSRRKSQTQLTSHAVTAAQEPTPVADYYDTTEPAPVAGSTGGCATSSDNYSRNGYSGDGYSADGNSNDPNYGDLADLGEQSAAFGGDDFVAMDSLIGGYIDPAVIQNRIRLRYDNFQGANFPDRAEYMYPAPAEAGGPGPNNFGGLGVGDLNIQELSTYIEWMIYPDLSVFGEFPLRWVDADGFSQQGFGDIRAGLRYGLVQCDDRAVTAQLRIYAPTGDAGKGLGTGHPSIEGGILFQRQYTDRWTWFGEVQDWQAIDGTVIEDVNGVGGFPVGRHFSGNVLRYGLGTGYDLWQSCRPCSAAKLTGVVEVVGWTVLDGFKTEVNAGVPVDADGDTIVNGKYGIRATSATGRISTYAGYGHNWTSQRWYSDMFRLEVTYNY